MSGRPKPASVPYNTPLTLGVVLHRVWVSFFRDIISKTPQLNDLHLISTGIIYFGDDSTDGSWKIVRDGNNLIHQRRESGSWVTKHTITP